MRYYANNQQAGQLKMVKQQSRPITITTDTDRPPSKPAGLGSAFKNTFASLAYKNFLYLWLGQVTHAGLYRVGTCFCQGQEE